MTEEKALTIFESIGNKARQEAINNLLKGRTPVNEVRKRPMRGGGEANYVNTYYMTRQISLLTGFRWSTEYLEDRARPNWDKPVEVGVRVRVIIWDNNGTQYSQPSWGQKDVAHYASDGKDHKAGDIISLFDDLKAAESDAIKKALSYFGIANDIYGGKELEFFAEDGASETTMTADTQARMFGKFLSEKHIAVSKAVSILGIKSLTEIKDYKEAHDTLVKELGL
jgi:hypothetical protein